MMLGRSYNLKICILFAINDVRKIIQFEDMYKNMDLNINPII